MLVSIKPSFFPETRFLNISVGQASCLSPQFPISPFSITILSFFNKTSLQFFMQLNTIEQYGISIYSQKC